MKMCEFRGCQKLDGHGGLHGRWDADAGDYFPLEEQRTPAQIMTERRERINREKAERIARQTVEGSNWIQPEDRDEFLDVATAAALAALTEKENAR